MVTNVPAYVPSASNSDEVKSFVSALPTSRPKTVPNIRKAQAHTTGCLWMPAGWTFTGSVLTLGDDVT
jgi:hypothetical protein